MKIAAVLCLFASLALAQTQVIMLGSGSPNADPDRSGPAEAVLVNGHAYLVDAGVGIVRRAAAAARMGYPELRAARLDRVFITHLHTDHTLGYPDLIFTPWVLGRSRPLEAWGPRGLQAMTNDILAAWTKDIAVRTLGLEHSNLTGYKVDVHEIMPGEVYHDANVTVTAFLVHHGNWDYAFGYKFVTADRTIVFSGDTSPVEAVARECDGCDLLFHEVYNRRGIELHHPKALPYYESFHTDAQQLARIATEAHPKLLVLYHQLFEGLPESDLLRQIRAGYKGAFVSSRDLDVY
jgi:ribonuclease BN (tRNA processing enzyme)